MAGTNKGEGDENEKESPPLQIDPKCFQDALRAFFQPIKTGDPRSDFYNMYKREAMEYDTDYVKKYDEDLNTTLIFAGLFSAVSSAFVLDIHSKLQPDPNDQSAALLRAILLTLNHTVIVPTVPLPQDDPPSEIVTATTLMYASLLISLLAAFVAMLGKQWLNRYLRNSGGSMIERCGDRQRKHDGLKKWPFHLFIETLPVMLQVSLLLLASGLCRYIWSVNTLVAWTLIALTGSGVLFYCGMMVAGMSSYACPLQTPVSIGLRDLWKKLRPGIALLVGRCREVLSRTHNIWRQSVQPLLPYQSPPSTPPGNQAPEQWLKPDDLVTILERNADDVRCVSWILRSITDPEALDAAIRLAGTVRWFEDGIDVEPPYDVIASVFRACFDVNGDLYPASRDRAYYSGQAILWIHTLAACKPRKCMDRFPLLDGGYRAPAPDHDLAHLLTISERSNINYRLMCLAETSSRHSPSHSQWVSNVLLHHCRANQTALDPDYTKPPAYSRDKSFMSLDVILNRLLTWSICLGSPIEEESLRVRDKSDCSKQILHRLHKSVVAAISSTHRRCGFIEFVLDDLIRSESRPDCLPTMVYEWCSLLCKNRPIPFKSKRLLLLSLEIGFRHFDPWDKRIHRVDLTHTEYHLGLVKVVFGRGDSETIADLLQAWTIAESANGPSSALLSICAEHLVALRNQIQSSSRLRRLVIRFIELFGFKGFEDVGAEQFVELLGCLHVTVEDMDEVIDWVGLLLDTLKHAEGTRHLPIWYWDLLVQVAIIRSGWRNEIPYNPQIMVSLAKDEEWEKLECWIRIAWIWWRRDCRGGWEKSLERATLLLFCQRPGAIQKLVQQAEGPEERRDKELLESLGWICQQAFEETQQSLPSISSADDRTEESPRLLLSAPSPPPGGSSFWESIPYCIS